MDITRQQYNDAQLLLLLVNDPQQGLAALLEVYGGTINGVVRRVLGRAPQDAEECVADVLVAAWQHAPELSRQHRSLKGWLCVTARNAAIDRWRRLSRTQTVELNEELAADWMLSPGATEAEEQIEALVNAMGEPDREIFIRRYWLLQPAKEIGAALGMVEHNVNVRLSRGRAKLKKQFLEQQKEAAHA